MKPQHPKTPSTSPSNVSTSVGRGPFTLSAGGLSFKVKLMTLCENQDYDQVSPDYRVGSPRSSPLPSISMRQRLRLQVNGAPPPYSYGQYFLHFRYRTVGGYLLNVYQLFSSVG